MILDSQLAQQIVDRTMAIIGYNINVMNQAGVIIGSGEKIGLAKCMMVQFWHSNMAIR